MLILQMVAFLFIVNSICTGEIDLHILCTQQLVRVHTHILGKLNLFFLVSLLIYQIYKHPAQLYRDCYYTGSGYHEKIQFMLCVRRKAVQPISTKTNATRSGSVFSVSCKYKTVIFMYRAKSRIGRGYTFIYKYCIFVYFVKYGNILIYVPQETA